MSKEIVNNIVERRNHSRFSINSEINYGMNNHKSKTSLKSLSLCGMLIKNIGNLKVGDVMQFEILFTELKSKVIIDGEIKYCSKRGAGIVFRKEPQKKWGHFLNFMNFILLPHFEKQLSDGHLDKNRIVQIANLNYELGNKDKAIFHYQKALKLFPDSLNIKETIARKLLKPTNAAFVKTKFQSTNIFSSEKHAKSYFSEDIFYKNDIRHRVTANRIIIENAHTLFSLIKDFISAICILGPSILEIPAYAWMKNKNTPNKIWPLPKFGRLDLGLDGTLYEIDNNPGGWGYVTGLQKAFKTAKNESITTLYNDYCSNTPLMVLEKKRVAYLRESQYFMNAVNGKVAMLTDLDFSKDSVLHQNKPITFIHRRFDFNLDSDQLQKENLLKIWNKGLIEIEPNPAPIFNKGWFAAIWDFSLEGMWKKHIDIETIRKIIPQTHVLGEEAMEWSKVQRKEWIIKILSPEVDARGEGIIYGYRTKKKKWVETINDILDRGAPAIVQRVYWPKLSNFSYFDPDIMKLQHAEDYMVLLRPFFFMSEKDCKYASGFFNARHKSSTMLCMARDTICGLLK